MTEVFADEEYHVSYEAVSGDARGLKQGKRYPPETPMSIKWTTVTKSYETPRMCQTLCSVQDFFFFKAYEHIFSLQQVSLGGTPDMRSNHVSTEW